MILQTHTTSLRPLTTAHLAQTMTLLELNGEQLRQKIEAELASNPALEHFDEARCPTCGRALGSPGACMFCRPAQNTQSDQAIVFISPYTEYSAYQAVDEDDDYSTEEWNAQPEDLPGFVLRQIAPDLSSDDRPLAAHILTSLDEDGLLRTPLIEIAHYHHVPISRVENVIHLIQRAEPIGVGSANPQQALLTQLEVLSETQAVPRMARCAILEGMDLLSRRAYNELAHLLGITVLEVQRLANFISDNLNPYPARAHWGDIHQGVEASRLYISPDVIITRQNDTPQTPLVVEILSPYAGILRVNPLFREAISQAPADKADSWASHLEQASLLVKCIQQRNHTMVRLMQVLAKIQRLFILEGDAYLVPITRAQLAEELDVHESTVSRAVSGKAVQLPNRRIILLDKFFDRSLQIRTTLRELIDNEVRPMSDTELANKLIQRGYPVARRTVAKYRAMEGILPARFRNPGVKNSPNE